MAKQPWKSLPFAAKMDTIEFGDNFMMRAACRSVLEHRGVSGRCLPPHPTA
jgi:hypothetical protein